MNADQTTGVPEPAITVSEAPAWDLAQRVASRAREGMRFAGLLGPGRSPGPDGSRAGKIYAILCGRGRPSSIHVLSSYVPSSVSSDRSAAGGQVLSVPSLTRLAPAADWYERKMHDMYGIIPVGHPHLRPLISQGSGPTTSHVLGEGMFTMPYGPVRSGVFEAVEYMIETPGEEIPHLEVRPHPKHRGIEERFDQLDIETGALLAERIEGVASVAHAIAFCQAVERICDASIPRRAALWRVLHAELERIANHLDVAVRLTEAAGLAVANARFGIGKEHAQRLRADLCGSRFGRGVVAPGGVAAPAASTLGDAHAALHDLEKAVMSDTEAALQTPSFVDRLRGAGLIDEKTARDHGAVGPLARASGIVEDTRTDRPYAAYAELEPQAPATRSAGDALARLEVRQEELHASFKMACKAISELVAAGDAAGMRDQSSRVTTIDVRDGENIGWSEGPHGEILSLVSVRGGRLESTLSRPASFHNLALLPRAFQGDILTDFAFIEASFGLSIAGAAL